MAKGDIISRLKLESGEFDAKIKRAGQELLAYSEHCRKMGLEMGYANKDAKEFAKALGSMQTVSQTARGKINELSEAFVNAKVMYNNMTEAEKQGEFGKNLAASLDQLKTRINDAKKDLADVQKELNDMGKADGSKFGQFGNVLDTLGSKLGVTGKLTELLTSKTALMTDGIGASVAIIGKATSEWAKYNAELSKQDQITTVTTGLDGAAGNKMTDQARALVDTYNVDFREVINAANTLMTQFGKSGDDAMSLIRQGMQGMIQGDGPKLLSMIQQYAPSFRDAGIAADQLVAIIHNSEGGLFTDANMNAIVMGIKNIRLMTNKTSEALAKMGIDGQEMTRKLNDGSMTIFEAMQQVSNAIERTGSGSQAAGEVMQYVFGRQGTMAGTKLGEAIATLNTNLDDTKVKTGDLGKSFDDLYEANVRLNTAIRDAFGYDGWEQMANGIKSKLIGALSDVIEYLAIIEEGFGKIKNFFGGGGENKGIGYSDIAKTQQWINNGKNDDERRRRYNKATADLQKKLNNVGKEYSVKNADGSISFKIDDAETQARKRAALEKRMSMLYVTRYTPEPDPIKPVKPTKHTSGSGSTSSIDKEAKQTAKMLAELRKAEAKATKEIADARAKEHQTETQGLSGFNEQTVSAWTSMMKDQLSKADFGSVVYDNILENMRDMTAITELTKEALKRGLDPESLGLTEMYEQAFDNIDVPDQALQGVIDKINEYFKDNPVKIDLTTGNISTNDGKTRNVRSERNNPYLHRRKDGKYEAKANELLGGISSGIGNIVGGLEYLGVSIPEGLQNVLGGMQTVSTILTGIATTVLAIEALTAADAFLPFANGGIVPAFANGGLIGKAAGGMVIPGNSFSGDNLRLPVKGGGVIGVNSGELILNMSQSQNAANALMSAMQLAGSINETYDLMNRAQQGNLSSQLEGANNLSNLNLTATIRGEQIRLALNNNGRRTGRGEYVTSKRTK